MPTKTEAQKKAQRKYMENISTIQIRTTADRRDAIKAHAEARGESVNGFINRAISEAMERDGGGMPSETAQRGLEEPCEAWAVSLPSETPEAAQRAAESAGEALPDFVARAIVTQAKRDSLSRRMEGAAE